MKIKFVARKYKEGYMVSEMKGEECVGERYVLYDKFISYCNEIGCIPTFED